MALQVQPRKLPLGISPEDLDALLRRAQQTSANQPEQTPVEPTNTIQKRLLQAAPQMQDAQTASPAINSQNPIASRLQAVAPTETILPPTDAARLRYETRPSPLMDASRIVANVPPETPVTATDGGVIQRPTNTPLSAVPPGLNYSTGDEVRARQLNESDELTKAVDALRDRQNAPLYNPDENGVIQKPHGLKARLLAALKMAGRGFERGGLPGAVSGGIEGAVDPTLPAQLRRQQQIAAAGQNVNQQVGIAKVKDDLADSRSQRALRDAQREKILHPRPKISYRNNAQGQMVRIEENEGEAPRTSIIDNAKKTAIPHTQWADDRLKIYNPETGEYDDALDSNHQPITSELRKPTDVTIHGVTYKVSPNTAATAAATGERFKIEEADKQEERVYQRGRDAQSDVEKDADYENKRQAIITANATIDRQIPELREIARKNRATAEDSGTHHEIVNGKDAVVSNVSLATRRQARAAADKADAQIGNLERRRKSVPAPRVAAPARSYSPTGTYAGKRMSRAKLPEAAKRLGMTAAQAEDYIKQQGGTIY